MLDKIICVLASRMACGEQPLMAAFVAQKLLKDPLNKIAQSEYTITGTWDSPVEKDAEKEKQEIKPTNSPLNAQ